MSKKKYGIRCKECGEHTHPLFLKKESDGICLLNMQIGQQCQTCNEFGKEIYVKDSLKFENPKMREEYVDAHTP